MSRGVTLSVVMSSVALSSSVMSNDFILSCVMSSACLSH